MEGFKEFLPQEVLVTRNGESKNMLAKYLIPGDVVSVGTGEKLPADLRCVTTKNFKCDQVRWRHAPRIVSGRSAHIFYRIYASYARLLCRPAHGTSRTTKSTHINKDPPKPPPLSPP